VSKFAEYYLYIQRVAQDVKIPGRQALWVALGIILFTVAKTITGTTEIVVTKEVVINTLAYATMINQIYPQSLKVGPVNL